MIYRKSAREIARIRRACRIVADALDDVEELIQAGVTTAEINRRIDRFIREAGGIPAFLGYQGFPASACVSINDEVVHGIPSEKRVLKDGDIVGIDVGVRFGGYYGDSARTYPVGTIRPDAERLLAVTRDSLELGIAQARAGNRVGDISAAVQRRCEAAGYSVVRTLVGHGVGRHLHEEPAIPNFGEPGEGPLLEPGMVFAIEPMVNMGREAVRTLDDAWTIVTADGSLSAHFEHSVAIAPDGPEILTLPKSMARPTDERG
jgi:methionyl aminopeptidase